MDRAVNGEVEVKLEKVRALLAGRGLNALLIQQVTNFAWLTAGASSYINTADSLGVASLLVVPHGRYLITNNIEAPRLREEEHLDEQGWEFSISPWYQAADRVAQMTKGLRLGTDGFYPGGEDVSTDLVHLRMNLLPQEQERLWDTSQGCAEAMNAAIHQIEPGLTEFEIAAILGGEIQRRGILPVVNLIATDQRIYSYRHPLPTSKKLERYAMLVACGRKSGLVCSITAALWETSSGQPRRSMQSWGTGMSGSCTTREARPDTTPVKRSPHWIPMRGSLKAKRMPGILRLRVPSRRTRSW
ncbi:MAG: aminopeptidase P family N-terminal domain-containing protein [Anaerolineales bacterium]